MYPGIGDGAGAGLTSQSASWADESGELSQSHFELGESTDSADGAGESTHPFQLRGLSRHIHLHLVPSQQLPNPTIHTTFAAARSFVPQSPAVRRAPGGHGRGGGGRSGGSRLVVHTPMPLSLDDSFQSPGADR